MTALALKQSGSTRRRALAWPLPQANRGTLTLVEVPSPTSNGDLDAADWTAVRLGIEDARSLLSRLPARWMPKIGAALELLLGQRLPRALANERLEALRLTAVRVTRRRTVTDADVEALIGVGLSREQAVRVGCRALLPSQREAVRPSPTMTSGGPQSSAAAENTPNLKGNTICQTTTR